jgi:hypothetical protein
MKIASVRADVYSHRFDGVAVTQGVGQMVKRDLVHAAENPNPLWHVRPLAVCLSSSSGTALPWWH